MFWCDVPYRAWPLQHGVDLRETKKQSNFGARNLETNKNGRHKPS